MPRPYPHHCRYSRTFPDRAKHAVNTSTPCHARRDIGFVSSVAPATAAMPYEYEAGFANSANCTTHNPNTTLRERSRAAYRREYRYHARRIAIGYAVPHYA